MTKKEFCMVLAKDVIKQVNRKKFKPTQGTYCELVGPINYGNYDAIHKEQLDALIKEENAKCKVCALGSLVASYALAKDNTTLGQAEDREPIADRLAPYFGKKQLDMIELTFEGAVNGLKGNRDGVEYEAHMTLDTELTQKELEACYNFHNRYDSADDLLLGIMRNIIKNEGRFVPKGL